MSLSITKLLSSAAVLNGSATPTEKASYVRAMFDEIAPRYDLLNDTLSMGIHHCWRSFATRCAALESGDAVLDVCTGTGAWLPRLRDAVGVEGSVVGVDFSRAMLERGDSEFRRQNAAKLQGDVASLPFADKSFNAATVAFGIRNVAEIERGFAEMARVVKPGGRVVCLEFAEPHPGAFRAAYDIYSRRIMPFVGGIISGRRDAYAYLPESVRRFKSRSELASAMSNAGLSDVRWVDRTFGLVAIHVGTKPG